jgi:hypothetical protein
MANKNTVHYPEIIVGKLENVPLFVNFVKWIESETSCFSETISMSFRNSKRER